MKQVVSNSMVAHLWAQQAQSRAQNGNRSFFFEGKTLFSYGSHFPIATIEPSYVLFTTKHSSVTTQKHISLARRALTHHEMLIECENPLPCGAADHVRNLKAMRTQFESILESAMRSRLYTDSYLSQAKKLTDTHSRYRALFGESLDSKLVLSTEWKEQVHKRIQAQKQAATESTRKHKEEEQKRIAKLMVELEKWKTGEPSAFVFHGCPVALRLKDNTVETSLGASVPVTDARKLWATVRQIRYGHVPPYQHNGHTIRVGQFRVDSIDATGTLQAGCHIIPFDAMQELATKEGW